VDYFRRITDNPGRGLGYAAHAGDRSASTLYHRRQRSASHAIGRSDEDALEKIGPASGAAGNAERFTNVRANRLPRAGSDRRDVLPAMRIEAGLWLNIVARD
jgi:hypothetical protein